MPILLNPDTPSGATGLRIKRTRSKRLSLAGSHTLPSSYKRVSFTLPEPPILTESCKPNERDSPLPSAKSPLSSGKSPQSSLYWSFDGQKLPNSPLARGSSSRSPMVLVPEANMAPRELESAPKNYSEARLDSLCFEPPHDSPLEDDYENINVPPKKVNSSAGEISSLLSDLIDYLTPVNPANTPADALSEIKLIDETIRSLKQKRRKLLRSGRVSLRYSLFKY